MDLKAYLKVYPNWIDDDICSQTIKNLQDSNWQQHQFYRAQHKDYVNLSGDKELEISYGDSSTTPYIMQRIWDAYQKYFTELDFSWFTGWAGYSQVRYNKYETGQLMALHCDNINSIFDGERKGIPILTALGCLNDDYEGGNFVMWDKAIKLKRGDVMVFPAMFLYPHKVEEVTQGTRHTFVSWAW